MEEKNEQVDLWITPSQKQKWEKVSQKLGLTIWEYIRRATDAYSNILIQDEIKIDN